MSSINLVLFSGKAGSGKDTAADTFECYYKYKSLIANKKVFVKKYAFADKLKEVLVECGWKGDKGLSGRKLLQAVGNGIREYNVDYWLEVVYDKITDDVDKCLEDNVDCVIMITDCRYINEIFKLYSMLINKYYNIKCDWLYVKRNDSYDDREMDSETAKNPSEIELDTVVTMLDYGVSNFVFYDGSIDSHVIINNMSLTEYKTAVKSIADDIWYYRYAHEQ